VRACVRACSQPEMNKVVDIENGYDDCSIEQTLRIGHTTVCKVSII